MELENTNHGFDVGYVTRYQTIASKPLTKISSLKADYRQVSIKQD
jgi:hypothetical protein